MIVNDSCPLPVRARLAIRSAFPIAMTGCVDSTPLVLFADSIMAALEHKDPMCCIDLPFWEKSQQ